MLLPSVLLTVILLRKGVFTKKTGDKVDAWLKNPVGNPEELGNYFEGDILLPKRRAGLLAEALKWPEGIIPYEIGDFAPHWRDLILDGMRTISSHTCIEFVPKRDDDEDYVVITSKHMGCVSNVGKVGGAQPLNLQVPACFKKPGTVIHELLHAVGFFHEQTRYDRDDYVEIIWENIPKPKRYNFDKKSAENISHYGVEYDYGSVMHYSNTAFSKNGEPTIISLVEGMDDLMGQRKAMADSDIKKVNTMYECDR